MKLTTIGVSVASLVMAVGCGYQGQAIGWAMFFLIVGIVGLIGAFVVDEGYEYEIVEAEVLDSTELRFTASDRQELDRYL